MESDRKAWIVSLRAIACMSIVLLHVVSTWVEGSQKTVNGMRYYMDLVIIQVLVRWAVPCFVMISGYLLLDISKNIDIRKLCKYIGKMLLVLITIGYLFCIIELVVNGERNASIIVTGLINLISGNSWAHMWYVYMMIGLYIVTPICRHFVAHAGEAEWKYTIVGLFIVCILIPTINDYSGLTITQFLIRNPYIFYYLVGYYLGTHHFLKYWGGMCMSAGGIGIVAGRIISEKANVSPDNLFVMLLAIGVFILAVKSKWLENISRFWVIRTVSTCSFGIYLIHNVILNTFYKGLHIYPDILPVGIGEILFWMIALLSSWLIVYIFVQLKEKNLGK